MSALDEVRVVDENDNDVKPGEVGSFINKRAIYNSVVIIKQKSIMHDRLQRMDFIAQESLVKVNEQGYIIVEGRDKDQINRGGEKVAAEEVRKSSIST